MPLCRHHLRTLIAAKSGPVMFVLSLVFLVCQSILVVVWVDVPNLSENALLEIQSGNPLSKQMRESLRAEIVDHRVASLAVFTMLAIWPLVILESIYHWLIRPWDQSMMKFHLYSLLFCISPSLRMCARSPELHRRMWLPGLGWRVANQRLQKRLERRFSGPMIVIALLIMPVLITEFFLKTQVAQYTWLRLMLHIGTGIIWFAFAGEFIVMVSVAKKKLLYCKEHWIDLAIIVLPLFAFLRSLRLVKAMGVAQTLRLPQLTKLARVYRLRGTAVKFLRALILLDFFYRITGNNLDRRIAKLQRELDAVESEAKQIRRQIAKLQRLQEEEQAMLETDS